MRLDVVGGGYIYVALKPISLFGNVLTNKCMLKSRILPRYS